MKTLRAERERQRGGGVVIEKERKRERERERERCYGQISRAGQCLMYLVPGTVIPVKVSQLNQREPAPLATLQKD